jgi:arginine decarboxylase
MARRNPALTDPLIRWSVDDSRELYSVDRWSDGFFDINEAGHVMVTPQGKSSAIDLKALVDEIQERGIQLPLLLRFSDILRSRIELLNHAFASAITECEYKGQYRGVYPIKVNQARAVVEEIIEYGRPFHYGLEAGSKPELLATLALMHDPEALIICNGYKDDEYIGMALLAGKIGRNIILVVEKPSELENIHRVATELGVKPTLGVRARLSARGSGKWEQSGGDFSKFGLSAAEMIDAVDRLRSWGELDCLRLLHFHLGSQISAIRSIKNALIEAGRFYVGLRELGCTELKYLDVGGGLGVDYDGSQTNFASSMNYSVQEYANDVVYEVMQVCDAAGVPHPDLVTESGRAITAHHSVLVVDVLEVSGAESEKLPRRPEEGSHAIALNLYEVYEGVSTKNVLEAFHDAASYKEQALQLFNLGHLSLLNRVACERLYWAIIRKILGIVRTLSHVPEDLQQLERTLSDTYFLNFSMFQSLPDAWAVEQLFPIMPIHRLDEEPRRRGVLADITCDSDGSIDSFIDPRDVKKVLELHSINDDQQYMLGIFLVGAYQEILGDMHNLFGDTAVVHISLDAEGRYAVEEVFGGDTVTDVLQYVDYAPQNLIKKMRSAIEAALREGRMTIGEARELIDRYIKGLNGYTYLVR